MHFDLWHRALESTSDTPRLMLKFGAWRTSPPRLKPVPRWPLADAEPHDGEHAEMSARASNEARIKAEHTTSEGDAHGHSSALHDQLLCYVNQAVVSGELWGGGAEGGNGAEEGGGAEGMHLFELKASAAESRLFAGAMRLVKQAEVDRRQLPALIKWLTGQVAIAVAREKNAGQHVQKHHDVFLHITRTRTPTPSYVHLFLTLTLTLVFCITQTSVVLHFSLLLSL